MSKDQTVFKLPQDPDFADGQSDRWTHGRRVNLKSPPVKHRSGTNKFNIFCFKVTTIFLKIPMTATNHIYKYICLGICYVGFGKIRLKVCLCFNDLAKA